MRKLELSASAATWTANKKKELSIIKSATQLVKETNNTHLNRIHINICDDPMFPLHLLPVDRKRKILGHDSILIDDLHTRRFQVKAELAKRLVFVQFGAVEKAARPGKDGRDWVGGCFFPILIFSVVPGYGAYTRVIRRGE
jgi:hypothetical protein